jgi:asparaginyl-tRNA synthetase
MKDISYFISERKANALRIQSAILKATGDYLRSEGFVEILPVVISPITDPLRHATGRAIVEYYNNQYHLTRSMIFHKQLAVLAVPKIFCFSPNIRLEPIELADTGRHLVEFVQLDLECRDATREDMIRLGENLIIHTLHYVKENCKKELEFLERKLRVPNKPFKRISYELAYEKYAGNFETVLSQLYKEPFWIIDVPLQAREFYDRESEEKPGYLVDMDLIWPEGFGEALSGGEREYSYDRIITRIKNQGLKVEDFIVYLQLARQGLRKSAGFGIGIERFTRYVCGAKRIEDVALFPKTPGELGI